MTNAIFPGSFDPITNGHINIIKNASKIFNKIIVAVSYNIQKKEFLTLEIRKRLIEEAFKDIENIEIVSYTGLTADFAKTCNADVIVRGLRNSADFEYEKQIAEVNNSLNSDLQTVFLLSQPETTFISSSVVREIFYNKGDISNLVPKPVYEYLKSFNQ